MFENKDKVDIKKLGEFGLIKHLTADIKTTHVETILGIGDDAAVLKPSEHQVISTDLLVENVHFDMVFTPLMHLGYKAIVISVADITAMNAVPKQALISLAISSKYSVEAIEELYKGIKAACAQYSIDLIGGDTTSSKTGLIISSTVIGEVSENELVKRDGAKPGDLLCITGDLGGAYAGLQMLEREKAVFKDQPNMQPDLTRYAYVVGRQLRPEARVDLKELFSETKVNPTSMIDVSDGLSSEIFHLCEKSSVGMKLYEDKIPIDQQTYDVALELNITPSMCALSGGEDYELLFTIPQSDYDKIKHSPDISVIGYCTEPHEGKVLITKSDNVVELEAQGWQTAKD